MFLRIKSTKGTPLVQLAQFYRDEQAQPLQRVIASHGDDRLPDAEQQRVYDLLGIDWKRAFPPVKLELPP